jgi:hypothetical protein
LRETETENFAAFAGTRRKNVRTIKTRPPHERRRKVRSRPWPGRNSRRKMATQRKLHPVAGLLEALEAEKIRFILIGMSAAIVQGVMESTLNVDFWIDLPARQYIRVQNIARRLGCSVVASTVIYAPDGTPVNFVFDEVSGLGSFKQEWKQTRKMIFRGKTIPVLKLEKNLKSKESIRRDKDLPHIIQIRELLRCRRSLKSKKGESRKP